MPGAEPIITGPWLDVKILFYCSGIEGVYLFDFLFGLLALWEWNSFNKRRLLGGYFLGLGVILAANVLRIVLMVLVGNLISPDLGEGNMHLHAGWVLFAIVFVVFLRMTYAWLREQPAARRYAGAFGNTFPPSE